MLIDEFQKHSSSSLEFQKQKFDTKPSTEKTKSTPKIGSE